nr:MAG TPA: hypothetical protein [Caudoviricetes sp.]
MAHVCLPETSGQLFLYTLFQPDTIRPPRNCTVSKKYIERHLSNQIKALPL